MNKVFAIKELICVPNHFFRAEIAQSVAWNFNRFICIFQVWNRDFLSNNVVPDALATPNTYPHA
jgi:hypothetical protein